MRKIRVAVVGPCDSVHLICEVAKEYGDRVEVAEFTYEDAAEVPAIIAAPHPAPDIWLFSGVVPYSYAVAANPPAKSPLFYIPHTGLSLYRALLQIVCLEKLDLDGISFDKFTREEIEATFADIPLAVKNIYVREFHGIISAAELTEYHYQLWKSGRTKAAVTTMRSTYLKLRELGVPAFRIWPLRESIRSTLELAIRTAEAETFKGSQIAIQHIQIDDYASLAREGGSGYDIRRLEAKLYPILIDYAEAVKGSINIHGHGQYTIYSTRGTVEEVTAGFTIIPVKEEIAKALTAPVSGGIGFGGTARAAEENAYKALGFARHLGKGNWMVVSDDGSVLGPLSSSAYVRYSLRPDSKASERLTKRLGVSITTVNRLLASLDKMDISAVGADELAINLSITPRSARRLLGALAAQGLASVSQEEALYKGRPRKLYRILVNELIAIEDRGKP